MTSGAWIILSLAALVIYVYETQTSSGGSGSSAAAGSGDDLIDSLLAGITQAENVNPSHNNPGAICGSYTNGVCNGPKTFATLDDGVAAAQALITKILDSNPALTLEQFVAKWTGVSSGAAFDNYLSQVEDATGLDATDTIGGEPTTGSAGTY